jgi:hypothetical protein
VIAYPGVNVTTQHRLALGVDHTLAWDNYDQVTLRTPIVTLIFTNSDHFLNLGAALVSRHGHGHGQEMKSNTFMHGLLGQTWRTRGDRHDTHTHAHKYQFTVEGEIDDYIVSSLFATPTMFNLYQ